MKKLFLITFSLLIFIFNNSSYALVEVDITRGNLDPLPIAVSPLYTEPGSLDIKGDKVKYSKKAMVELDNIKNYKVN